MKAVPVGELKAGAGKGDHMQKAQREMLLYAWLAATDISLPGPALGTTGEISAELP